MSDQQRHNYPVWDRFFDLLYPCDEGVSDAEVDADLKRMGIDMEPAFRRLHKMVEAQRARAQFVTAKEMRASIVDRIRDVLAPKLDDLRTGVKELIGRAVNGPEQLAYFHKLEGAATEEDLQSLMDDLEKLAALRELGQRNDSPTKQNNATG